MGSAQQQVPGGFVAVPGSVFEVVVAEAGELRWQDDGVADDRQVGVIRVVVEVVGGEFDDAGQREGVEADEGCGDVNVRRKRGVVQAPA
ncbi:hypothetical protein AB0N17_33590 [Streptomyces sp. NPDC051133]|uniref:hypothetical protein n=1 Tax=Streptomyces sp. NPDC051133 TaxID=3155521 RepID=UPI00341DB340